MSDLIAEQATGCRERVRDGGRFYSSNGDEISDTEARRAVREGETVELSNASAGSYRGVARRLGFKKIEVEDWTSSAGDWCFKLKGGRFMYQTNLWPQSGFCYSIGRAQ